MATKEDIERWIGELSSQNAYDRGGAAYELSEAAEKRGDISAAVPGLVKLLSDEDGGVQEHASVALIMACRNKKSRDYALNALLNALSDGNARVRKYAAFDLGKAAEGRRDISAAVPGLVKLLSDEDGGVREHAAGALGFATKKTEIDLEEVKKALTLFVEKEAKKGREERKRAAREAGEYYTAIANAVSKRRKAINMDGILLPDKLKPPKKPKMYRQRVAV